MQEQKLKIKGLYSTPDPYSAMPEGALRTADNIVIDREEVATPRRGYAVTLDALPSGTANVINEYQSTLIAQYGTSVAKYSTTWSAFSGTFTPISGTRMRFLKQSGNLYFNTAEGIKKLASISGTVTAAGVPKALDISGVVAGSGTFLANNKSVAYRAVWGIRDANNNLILGTPSNPVVLTNTSGTAKDTTITIYVPSGITTSHFVQLYRSAIFDSSVTPDDELYLVYESNWTSGASISVTDSVDATLTGASLYTSPSQEGILQANDLPPLCEDMATFKGYTFFANTSTKQKIQVTLLGVGSPALQANDTITVGVEVYTAKATRTTAGEFALYTAGTPAQDIEQTALNLVREINLSSASYTAYYMSNVDELPGEILIEAKSLSTAQFSVSVSRAVAWSLPSSTSSNDDWANGLFWSKKDQPEAVPMVNYVRVGSANDPILRIVANRDSLFIFKSEEGIYRLYGNDPTSFEVTLFDSSTRLLAKETLAVLNNSVYGYFDQGVCVVSETGVNVVSRPIEKTLLELQGSLLSSIKSLAWAVSYESDRKYIIHFPTTTLDTSTTQAYVWNTFTNTWTRWSVSQTCGFVRPSTDILYCGVAGGSYIANERKAYNFTDHADAAFTVTIGSVSGTSIVLSDVSGIEVGDVLWQSASVFGIISAINTPTLTVTVSQISGFAAGSASILPGFETTVEWWPFHAGQPMMQKHFREVSFLFENTFVDGQVYFYTDQSRSSESLDITGSFVGLWGLFSWGLYPWGGAAPSNVNRVYVPRAKQRAAQLNIKFTQSAAYNAFALNGAQVTFNAIGEKTTRSSD